MAGIGDVPLSAFVRWVAEIERGVWYPRLIFAATLKRHLAVDSADCFNPEAAASRDLEEDWLGQGQGGLLDLRD
jgi:hypothetical protein